MEIKNILDSWSKNFGIGNLQWDEQGVYSFKYEGIYYISIENDIQEKGAYIYSVVGVVPPERKEEITLNAIKANLFGKETGLSTLGYDENTQTLILSKYIPNELLNERYFTDQMEEFLAYRMLWAKKFESPILDTPKESESITASLRETIQKEKVQIFFA
ncbi:MAG: type III secretion system chaperone [Chlamydiota bacterium]|nr:type III secretion system chaperone [Chlamydiota bacterium]